MTQPVTPQTDGDDDKFIVLVSTDNEATWTVLRQWDNAGSTYVYNNITYWKQQGIFLLKDPSYSYSLSDHTINLSLCDKFGMFDGSVFGKTEFNRIINL